MDYVYIPRKGDVTIANYNRELSTISEVKDIWKGAGFVDECIEPTTQIICKYYLPSCGNSTHFEPPTSVCRTECHIQSQMCPIHWSTFVNKFNWSGAAPINCSNTGEIIYPLPHCCSNVGMDIVVYDTISKAY